MKDKVLVVEDSPIILKVLSHLVVKSDLFDVVVAASYVEAQACLASADFFAAIVDLQLPDASQGAIVDLMLQHSLPCIVLTGNLDEVLRWNIISRGVIDYIFKENHLAYNTAVNALIRLKRNQNVGVLVVEDSPTSRFYIKALLEKSQFQVFEAENGQQALARLEANKAIRLLITDYSMPIMNGCDLVAALRRHARFQDLVIIGLSADDDPSLSAKFIKSGANDFLRKPFHYEEFNCRIQHNLDTQEMLLTIRELAHKDDVTKLYNRRYLLSEGEACYQNALASGRSLAVVLIQIEDVRPPLEGGYLWLDRFWQAFAAGLQSFFDGAVIARLGDRHFCLLLEDADVQTVEQTVFDWCQILTQGVVGVPVKGRYSVMTNLCDSLDAVINCLDQQLHRSSDEANTR